MIESEQDQPGEEQDQPGEEQDQPGEGATSPEEPIHEATTPPGSGPRDEQAERTEEAKLRQAGAGH